MACYVLAMSRASSDALKHPPVTAPSEPAGALSPFPELAVAIERERRRGRGAQSNASGRFEAEARVAFDDGWQSLEELPPFKTTVARRHRAQGHHPQRFARHRLRPLDQSVSRLRAWLRLLLCAADPRLSRPVAGARFRIETVRQAGRAGAAREGAGGAGLRAAHDRDRHQHRSLSADRARAEDHARHSRGAGARGPSGRHRHQVGAGDARYRHPRADGEAQSRQGGAVGDHARSETGAHHGAAGLDAGRSGWRRCGNCRRPAFRPR